MLNPICAVLAMLMLLPAGEDKKNEWRDRVPDAVKRALQHNTIPTYREALDIAWRADDWQAGEKLAQEARKRHGKSPKIAGALARALWRAGQIEAAEKLAALIPEDTEDRVALRMQITIALAQGRLADAQRWADRLEKVGPESADDYNHLFGVRFAAGKLDGAVELLRSGEKRIDPKNGYPDTHLGEALEGLAEYFAKIGPGRLNALKQPGSADMFALAMFNLPTCEAYINGKGPYRLIIDTGGSIMLALDQTVADEVGLKSLGRASVRGVSGKQETEQALIDELRLGDATLGRVMTRTFDVRAVIMGAADGILGTGVFSDARMTMDFARGKLILARSSQESGPGTSLDIRMVGDAKLMALAQIEKQPAVGLLDTGADAVALAPSRLKQHFPDREVQKIDLGVGIGVGSDQLPGLSINPGIELKFGGRTFQRYSGLGLDVLDDTLGPVLGVRTDILIGMPTFREMRTLTVDYPRCQVWVDWLKRD